MQDVIGALGGFRGVRADLLVALKRSQPMTAHELGEQFGLTANALRRHLKVLEEDGLVRHEREVRGVGAPVYRFFLTAAGEALFPRGYVDLLTKALEAIRAAGGAEALTAVLAREWDALGDEAAPVVEGLPLSERVPLVAELLTSKGYMAEAIELAPPGGLAAGELPVLTLRIHNCAVREIAQRFPEACAAEARFVERMLGTTLERGAHRLQGCGRCEYRVTS